MVVIILKSIKMEDVCIGSMVVVQVWWQILVILEFFSSLNDSMIQ